MSKSSLLPELYWMLLQLTTKSVEVGWSTVLFAGVKVAVTATTLAAFIKGGSYILQISRLILHIYIYMEIQFYAACFRCATCMIGCDLYSSKYGTFISNIMANCIPYKAMCKTRVAMARHVNKIKTVTTFHTY